MHRFRQRDRRAKTLLTFAIAGPLALCALALVLFGCLRQQSRTNAYSYIARITGVTIPQTASDVDQYDNGETVLMVHVQLQPGDVDVFLAKHGFTPVVYGVRNPETMEPEILSLMFEEDRAIPQGAERWAISGCSPTNAWRFLMDKRTGRLWIQVFYPDWAGDADGCGYPTSKP